MSREQLSLYGPVPPEAGEPKGPVLMIGHSNHSWDWFAELLTRNAVTLLIDVRTSPQSRFCPQFNAKTLGANLVSRLGIGYHHAPVLGGKNPYPLDEQRRHIVEELPLITGACLMCSEGNYRTCHRHYTLTPLFLALGFTVEQILPDGSRVKDTGPTPATLQKMRAFLP